jgi:hypothetical protein
VCDGASESMRRLIASDVSLGDFLNTGGSFTIVS